ncbi:MAG TPA: HAD-IB family hydrolase [Acidimicrobiales bacterium]|jgi:putative phosphoserine phosphatase/1-acylglycerol-3-phosphate O-acyltransferase|nr:HAD-IB family hydrolase [Acidimicrobiales bacterium]
MATAAVFDLDRTLLRTSSTPALNHELHAAGLVGRASIPGQSVVMGFYDVFGETIPSMALARAAARAARGWPVAQVAEAAEKAGARLEEQLQPHARALIEKQREYGHLLVLATTTPKHLIGPLAERLGFDEVIATEYATRVDTGGVERYSGQLAGGFVWARGKLQAVRRWAAANNVDLKRSAAFSDSFYDLPLLGAVGHPTAVNPDLRLQAVATLRRWRVLHLDAPPGVPRLLGVEPLDLARLTLQQTAMPLARLDIQGTEHIPRHGPAILVSNHRSYFDPLVWVMTAFEAGRNPRSLGKKEVLDAPVIGDLAKMAGTIRVDRDGGGNAAYVGAEEALRGGEVVLIAPEATIPRGMAFFDPELKGKTGAARLAAATGAPIIPMGIWGSEKVWPRSARLPPPVNFVRRPEVRLRVGPPVRGLSGTDFAADTEKIMAAIVKLLPAQARDRHDPTPEELAATMPPGHKAP